jgi:hypothetical protein
LALVAAMAFSMNVTSSAEVSVAEREPDWNEAGLRLQELISENAECPDTLAMLRRFQVDVFDELTGEMPTVIATDVVDEVMAFEGQSALRDMTDVSLRLNGISTMNATMNFTNVPCCCLRWEITVTNGTVTIVKPELIASNVSIEVPAQLRPHSTIAPGAAMSDVTRIAPNAFTARTGERFTSVTLPASITRVDSGAFANNSRITTVRFRGSILPTTLFGTGVFTGSNNIAEFQVPLSFVQVYRERLNGAGVTVTLAGNAVRNRLVGLCRNTTGVNRNCLCCAFRAGDTNGTDGITVQDALLILNYAAGGSNAPIIRDNWNSRNAALILPRSRANGQPREFDAEDILRALVSLCSHTNLNRPGVANVQPCTNPTCNCTK